MVDINLIFNEAKEGLDNVELLLKNEKYNLCVSECYYAMFYGSKSLLELIDIVPKRHGGTMSEFSKHYVKTGIFPEKIAKFYFQQEIRRNKADYEVLIRFTKLKASLSIERATLFLDECEKIIKSNYSI